MDHDAYGSGVLEATFRQFRSTLAWEEAMDHFRDATSRRPKFRRGPLSEGHADPVVGVVVRSGGVRGSFIRVSPPLRTGIESRTSAPVPTSFRAAISQGRRLPASENTKVWGPTEPTIWRAMPRNGAGTKVFPDSITFWAEPGANPLTCSPATPTRVRPSIEVRSSAFAASGTRALSSRSCSRPSHALGAITAKKTGLRRCNAAPT